MPLYEYKCDSCGDVFELIQKFSDTPLTVHEKCGGPVHRLISAPALQFKGSGWYITDYAKSGSSGNGSSKSGESKSEDKSNSEGKSKSESKSKSEGQSKSAETKSEAPSKPASTTSSSDK